MPLIEHFEPSASPGPKISLRSIGPLGLGLATQLKRERGARYRIHFERKGHARVVIRANILDARFRDLSSGGLEDSSLEVWLKFDDAAFGHEEVFKLFQAGDPVEVMFELLP